MPDALSPNLSALLILLWAYFPLSVVIALLTGVIPAHGAKGGGFGFGHLCDRREDPATFKGAITLNVFVAVAIPVILFFGPLSRS